MSDLYFEDLYVGMRLPDLVKGPMSTAHIMRWSSSIELWHRIHYDADFARNHDGLPGLLVNGSWKQHVLMQFLTDWAGGTGWLWTLDFQYRGMNVAGETLTAWGFVAEIDERNGIGVARVELGIKNENDAEGTPGTGVVVFPRRGSPPLPYPFDPVTLGL